MSPLTKVADVRTPTLVIHGAADLHLPGRPGPAVAHRTARARGADPAGALSGRQPRVHPARDPVAAARLQPPGPRLGRAARRPRRPRDGSTPALGAPPRASWRSGTRSPAPSSASCATRPAARTSSSRRRTARSTWRRVPRRRRRRCSRSAPSPRSGRPRSSSSWSTRAWSSWTPRSSRWCPSSGSSDPDVTKSVTIRHLLTHTSGIDGDVFTDTGRGRRLPGEVRRPAGRGGAEPPPRRDLVLLQLRLLAARPGDREAHRHHVGPGDARPAVHPARARPDRDASGGGDPALGCRRPHRQRRRAGPEPGVGPDALGRPRGPGHLDRGRRARVRPHAPGRRSGRRRHAGALGGSRPPP